MEKRWSIDLVGDSLVAGILATSYEVEEEAPDPRIKFFNGTDIVAEYRMSQIQGWRLESAMGTP